MEQNDTASLEGIRVSNPTEKNDAINAPHADLNARVSHPVAGQKEAVEKIFSGGSKRGRRLNGNSNYVNAY